MIQQEDLPLHYLTYILVEWDEDDMPEDQLDAIADELLAPWHNEIWDWFEVGGRWNGVIPGNRIPVSGNEELVLEILDNVENHKKVEARIFLREVLGEHVPGKTRLGYLAGQKPSGRWSGLKHGDLEPVKRKVPCRGKAGGTSAHHRHSLRSGCDLR